MYVIRSFRIPVHDVRSLKYRTDVSALRGWNTQGSGFYVRFFGWLFGLLERPEDTRAPPTPTFHQTTRLRYGHQQLYVCLRSFGGKLLEVPHFSQGHKNIPILGRGRSKLARTQNCTGATEISRDAQFLPQIDPRRSKLPGTLDRNAYRLSEWFKPVNVSSEEYKAFQNCKDSLCQAALLAHPDCSAKLALVTDASDKAIGAVLQHLNAGAWEPLAFFSRKLSPAQVKYSPYDSQITRHLWEYWIF